MEARRDAVIRLLLGALGLLILISAFVVVSLWEMFDMEQADLDDD
jgi:hypothetical protein